MCCSSSVCVVRTQSPVIQALLLTQPAPKPRRDRLVFVLCMYDFPGGSDGKSICLQCQRPGVDPWVGRFPGEGNGNPLQCSCLENPMDRGAWQATLHGVSKSKACLTDSAQPCSSIPTLDYCQNLLTDLLVFILFLLLAARIPFPN